MDEDIGEGLAFELVKVAGKNSVTIQEGALGHWEIANKTTQFCCAR